jgi:hypothetical protein
MQQLHHNWITEGLLDFEYKKYILLAYLQEVNKNFDQSKLYPFLSDLVSHYNNIISLKKKKQQVISQFPKKITKIDLQNFKLHYESIIADDEYMEIIEEITGYAIPLLKQHVQQGAELYEFVEDKISLFPIGVMPIHNSEGYLFIKTNPKKSIQVFEYTITIFESANEKYRGIKTQYLTAYKSSTANTFENIKFDLIKNIKKLPNPATYALESQFDFPLQETILPIAKRVLVKEVCKNDIN